MSPGLQRRDSAACEGVKALRRSPERHLLRAHSWRLPEFVPSQARAVSCAAAPWRWQAQDLRGAGEFSHAVLRLAKASSGPACLDVFCHPSTAAARGRSALVSRRTGY